MRRRGRINLTGLRAKEFMQQPVQTIELDCAPGALRPGDLIGKVIEGTGLPDREPVGKFFGCWTWDYADIPVETWLAARPTLKARVIALYESSQIRYGSW